MKILHFADIHARDKDIQEIEKCLNFIVEIAEKEQPDLIVNAGDTFDSAGIKADSLSAKLIFKIVKELADIAPVVIIIGTKSHDGEIAETLQYIKAKHPAHVATFPEQLYFAGAHGAGVLVSMCPAPTKQHFATGSDIKGADSEIAQAMSLMFAGFAAQAEVYDCPHLLAGHWNITGSLISETQSLTGVDIELSKEQMALSNADICLMGHIHKAQKLEPNIFYPGSITGLNWGELSDKGFYIHELEGKKLIETRFIKTPSRKLIKLSGDLTGKYGFDSLNSDIRLFTINKDVKDYVKYSRAVVRVELKVFQDEAAKISLDEIKESLMSSGAKEVNVQLIRIPRENVRSQKILHLTNLRDKTIERAALKNEIVPESILAKADLLESEEADKIIQRVAIEGGH